MRHQLKDTAVKVVEIIPPMVKTDFVPSDMRQQAAVDVDVFASSVMTQLLEGREEISYGTDKIIHGSREQLDEMFKTINSIPPAKPK